MNKEKLIKYAKTIGVNLMKMNLLKIFTKKLLEIVIMFFLKNKKKRRKNDIELIMKKYPKEN